MEYHNVANKTLLIFYYFNNPKTHTVGFVHTISGRNRLGSNDNQDLFMYFLANTTLLLRSVTLTVTAPQQLWSTVQRVYLVGETCTDYLNRSCGEKFTNFQFATPTNITGTGINQPVYKGMVVTNIKVVGTGRVQVQMLHPTCTVHLTAALMMTAA